MTRGWCRYVLSSFLLIAPAASTICSAQSAPQETAAGKQAKAAGAQNVLDAAPQESSADAHTDAADTAPDPVKGEATDLTQGVTANAAADTTLDFTKDFAAHSTADFMPDFTAHSTPDFTSGSTQNYDTTIGKHLFPRFAKDQEAIWTAPAHLRLVDVDWLLPLGIATGAMLATDTEVSRHLSDSPSRMKNANRFFELWYRFDGRGRRGALSLGPLYARRSQTRDRFSCH